MTERPFKVNAYTAAIPPGNKNPEKPKLLQYFIEGVQSSGDKGMIINCELKGELMFYACGPSFVGLVDNKQHLFRCYHVYQYCVVKHVVLVA